MALILNAGAEGIERQLPVREAIEQDLSNTPLSILEKLDSLPNSLSEAVELCRASDFVHEIIPEYALESFIKEKETEYMSYLQADNKTAFEMDMYFKNI